MMDVQEKEDPEQLRQIIYQKDIQLTEKSTIIDDLAIKLAASMQHIQELEGALKQTSFVTASKVGSESQVSVDNAKYRTLLQVMSIPITITETGDYIIYSDPVKKVLEIRKASPRP